MFFPWHGYICHVQINNYVFVFVCLCLLFTTSCTIEKRYHQPGFAVTWPANNYIANTSKSSIKQVNANVDAKLLVNQHIRPKTDLNYKKQVKQVHAIQMQKWVQTGHKGAQNTNQIKAQTPIIIEPTHALNDSYKTANANPGPRQEIFGLIGFLILPLLFIIGNLGAFDAGLEFVLPVSVLLSLAFSGFSLGRISAKPYKFKGKGLAFLTLAFIFSAILFIYLNIIVSTSFRY